MKTRFLRWGFMFGLPVMVAVVVFTLSAFTNAAGDKGCPAVDPLGHTVLLPNPADCSTFFSCSEGVPILMHCPDGLHFNAELDVCDWPQDADCEDKLDTNYSIVPQECIIQAKANGKVNVAGLGLVTANAQGEIHIPGMQECEGGGKLTCAPKRCADFLASIVD